MQCFEKVKLRAEIQSVWQRRRTRQREWFTLAVVVVSKFGGNGLFVVEWWQRECAIANHGDSGAMSNGNDGAHLRHPREIAQRVGNPGFDALGVEAHITAR